MWVVWTFALPVLETVAVLKFWGSFLEYVCSGYQDCGIAWSAWVFMWRCDSRLEQIKKFTAEAPINSASLHQCEKFFVAGGEDFKMYKFDYETGKEIGESWLCLFFSPFFSPVLSFDFFFFTHIKSDSLLCTC